MTTIRLLTEGQLVLPKALRDDLGWQSGDEFAVERGGDGSVTLRRKSMFPPRTIDEVAGCLKYDGPPITLEDMERGIEAGLLERWAKKFP